MTLVGYINSMTPSDRLISSGTKDRFYVGFKSDKSQNLDGELLLKFCVANAERTLLNARNCFFDTGQNHLFFCVKIVIDPAVLQIVCIAEICGGRYRQPFFNKAVQTYTNHFFRPLGFL